MALSLRCRYWSVLQVVAIVVCYRGNVLSERAQGCVGSQLSLRCPAMKVIQITAVVLGDSNCRGARCCIRDNDCVRDANENHRTDVHRTCGNKQSCTVGVLTEKISCGYWGAQSNNDFERITYNCINDPQRSTTAKFSIPATTEYILHTEENTSEKQTENGSSTATFSKPDSTENSLRTAEITPETKTENDDARSSTDLHNKDGFDQNVNGHEENVSPEDRPDNSWSTTATFSMPDSSKDILHTKVYSSEKETENDDTTTSTEMHDKEGSDQTANAHDETPTHEDWPYNSYDTTSSTDFQTKEGSAQNVNVHDENVTRGEGTDYSWSATVAFSRPDSTENILRTKENTPEKETENDGTTSSTDFQTKGNSDRNVNGHDENVSHEDRVYNPWSTTVTYSRPDSTKDILHTKKNPPEKETENDDTVISTDIKDKEGSDQYVKGLAAHHAHEDRQGNSWLMPVVMATGCLLVLITIAVVVAMLRRRRRTTASITVEMADIGNNDRNEAIYTNENQTVSLNNGNGSPMYSNDENKTPGDPNAKVYETYEVPNNVVYSLADDAGSRPTEDPNVLESKETAYQVPRPRSDVYSVARDVGEPECAGSTADASKVDNNAYCYAEN